VMYRVWCTYGRVLTARHVTSLVAPQVPTLTSIRGYAKPAQEGKKDNKKDGKKDGKKGGKKDGKTDGTPKVKKPKVKRVKTPVDTTRPHLFRDFNTPVSTETPIPSVTRQELKELIETGKEKFLLVDLRTDAEMLLVGDAPILSAVRMPTQPLTHINTYKPPKVKVDKTAKGKKAKKSPRHAAAAKGKSEPAKVEPQQKDIFLSSYKMTSAMWEAKYKFPKIGFEDKVIFFSSSNLRSSAVVNSAMKLGYKNVKILDGGSRIWNKYYNVLGQ